MTMHLRLIFLTAWILLGSLSALMGETFQETWPQWRGAERNGTYRGEAWPVRLSAEQCSLEWTQALGSSYSMPVLDLQRIFVTESVDSDTESVKAFDRSNGKLQWSTTWKAGMKVPFFARSNGSWMRSTPALHDGKLFVMGMQETLVCLDAISGDVVWRLNIPSSLDTPDPSFGGVSSPLLHDGHLYVQAGGGVVKVGAGSGHILWSSALSKDAMNSSPFSSPIIAQLGGVPQLVVLGRSGLNGLDMADGSSLWRRDVPAFRGMNILTPTIIGEGVFTATYGGKAHLFQPGQSSDGVWSVSESWQQKFQGYMSSPVVVGDHAYIHGRSGRLVCLDTVSGAIAWTSGKSFTKYCSIVANGDRLLVLSTDGKLRLLAANPERCEILDELRVSDEETWAHLSMADDQVVIRSLNHLSVFRWKSAVSSKTTASRVTPQTVRSEI
jgi:outer membrane protein assembly factor BamB